jgi:hypothetical protein
MADEPQEKQSQYASFSFGVSRVAYQQQSPGGPLMACPPWSLMSTHASVLVDSVGPPSAEICRAAASFP